MTAPVKEILAEGVELWLGDCRDVLPLVGKVDAVVTDPPYGVGLTGKSCHSSGRVGFDHAKNKITYASYLDTEDNFDEIVIPSLNVAIRLASCAAVFTADTSIQKLPPYKALGGIYLPAGTGSSSWGFQCFMHCVFYGSDPYLKNGLGGRPNGKYGLYGNDANKVEHPCAKPIDAMMWAVERASLEDQTILDHFMGSGTTGVAAVKLGRKFIGVEIEPTYYAIAKRRITEALKQPDLFIETPKPAAQPSLLDAP